MSNVECRMSNPGRAEHFRKATSRRRAQGAAMLLVIIALAVASILALSFLRASGPTMAIASNNDKHNKARAVAESGLEFAIAYVKENPDWRITHPHGLWLADVPYEGGSFSVYGTDDDGDLGDDLGDELELAVVGRYQGVSHRAMVRISVAAAPFSMEAGTVVADGTPQIVSLQGSYNRPVVVCTPQVVSNSEPFIVRVDTVTGGSFRVWLQRCDGQVVQADTVHYMVMEEGVYNVDGMLCEARRFESTQTDYYPNWDGQRRSFGHSYNNPVVFGQVMTTRDADWSVFWCRGGSASSTPTNASFYIGKHVGEDPNHDRADETLGYIVFESGRHTINGVGVDVRMSSDSIMGVTNGSGTDAPYHQSFDNPPEVVVASQSGMDGNNGSWAMLWGAAAVTTSRVRLIVDEDMLGDPERSHTNEEVGVIAFERPPDAMSEQTVLQYEFDQAEFTPHAVAHWRLDEPAGGGGGVACYDRAYLNNFALIDSYDSSRGTYGPTNNSESATVSTNSIAGNRVYLNSHSRLEGDAYVGGGGDPDSGVYVNSFSYITGQRAVAASPAILPDMNPPGDMPAVNGDLQLNGTTTLLVDQDLHHRDLYLYNDTVLQIQGHRRIQVDRRFRLHNNARVELLPGASLTLWVGDAVEIYNNSQLNNDSTATGDLTIYLYGNNDRFRMSADTRAAGTVYTRGDFRLDNDAVFFGRVLAGGDVELYANSVLHADSAMESLGIATTPAVDEVLANDGGYRGDAVGGAGKPPTLIPAGTAAVFDGSGDFLEIPHSDTYLLNEGTVALWFNADATAGTQGLLCKEASGFGEGGHLSIALDGNRVKARLQSDSASYELTSGPISAGQWTHVAFAFGAEGLTLYMDGSAADSADYGGGMATTSGGSGNRESIVIGADTSGAASGSVSPRNHYFAGRIDDVRLYDQWCSAAQAAEIMVGQDPSTRLSDTLVMDTATYGEPLHLRINNPDNVTWDQGLLHFNAPALAESLMDATKVHTAITQSGAFSVVLRFQRADPITTSNPSIIMGVSGSTSNTNFLLGQAAAGYEARTRTNQTGASGLLLPPFAAANALPNDDLVNLTLTYDGTTLRTYIDGQLDKSQPLAGSLSAWSASLPVVIGSAAGGQFPWLGTIDSARVYNEALSTSQVTNLAQGLPLNAVEGGTGAVIWVESR